MKATRFIPWGALGTQRRSNRAWLGVVAFGMSAIATLAIRVASVPIFIESVGVRTYGQWLIVTAIPAYLSLSDVGFASVSATAATQELALGDQNAARCALCSAWCTVTAVAMLGFALLAIATWFVLPSQLFSYLPDGRLILIVQLCWTATWLQIGYVEAAFRAAGLFPKGTRYLTLMRLGEAAIQFSSLLVTHSLLVAASAQLAICLVSGALVYRRARSDIPWFSLRLRFASYKTAKELWKPSIAYAGYSAGSGLLNQGFVLAIGHSIGSSAVVVYTTVRTVTNSIFQLSSVVVTGSLPELTISIAAGAIDRARRIVTVSSVSGVVLAGLCGIALFVVGPDVVAAWTGHHVVTDRLFLALMTATTLADVPLHMLINMLRAINRHQRSSVAYLISCCLALLLLLMLVSSLRLNSAPVALFILDLVVIPVAALEVSRNLRRITMHNGEGKVTSTGKAAQTDVPPDSLLDIH